MIQRKPHHKGFKQKTYQEKINQWKPKVVSHQIDSNDIASHTKPLKRHKRMNPIGKSNRSKERRLWQAEMVKRHKHITWCVWPRGCSDRTTVAHAHRLKKTKITTREEWVFMCARLCQTHHNYVEYGDTKHKGTHRRMFRLVTALINIQKKYFE